MNLKANNIRNMLLHVKEIEAPMSLTAADVACIKIKLNFISTGAKFHGSSVMALINIFINIFYGLD
jgi:hypothetical protein